MHLLPKDLNIAISDMNSSILYDLKKTFNNRSTIEFKFEGIKFNKIALSIYNTLDKENIAYLTYSDPGAVALAKRDYPEIKENIFTFKSFNESVHINETESILLSVLPQPYDFDSFEPMCENFKGKHYSLNPKFEDANIGIGSVIRERRKNFVNTWTNIYFIQPINKGALMHIYPEKWSLFKEQNNKYYFVKEFESKPDNETIFINL